MTAPTGEKARIVVVSPSVLLDLGSVAEEIQGSGECQIDPARCSCARRRPAWRHPLPHRFDPDRALWLDLDATEAMLSREHPLLDEPRRSRIRGLIRDVSGFVRGYAAIASITTAMIALASFYEKGIDHYLDHARGGERLLAEHPAYVHLSAPVIGAWDLLREKLGAADSFGERANAKRDSLMNEIRANHLTEIAEESIAAQDHARISPDSFTSGQASAARIMGSLDRANLRPVPAPRPIRP